MKLKLSRKVFTLALAVLIGAAMTPCVLHAQSQSTTTTSTSKASSRKAKKEAKKEARAEKKAAKEKSKAESKAAESSSAAATSTKAEETHASAAARSHHEANTQSATPPSPGMVWVNTSTHVYHKAGSKWAGHTKNGKWMSEADAQAAGYKAARN